MQKQIKFKNNLILKRIIFLIILVLTFWIIFNFSEQSGEESGSLSERVTSFVVGIIAEIKIIDVSSKDYFIEILHPIIRKMAHFTIYTVVGFSIMGFMCTFDMKNIIKFSISFGVGVFYAISDEIHQYFTPGRGPSVIDVGIDSLGVITGIFILVSVILFADTISNKVKG